MASASSLLTIGRERVRESRRCGTGRRGGVLPRGVVEREGEERAGSGRGLSLGLVGVFNRPGFTLHTT